MVGGLRASLQLVWWLTHQHAADRIRKRGGITLRSAFDAF